MTNMSNTPPKLSFLKVLGWTLWIGVILLVSYVATTNQMAQDERRREAVVNPEVVSVNLTGARLSAEPALDRFGGIRWTVLETQDWLLVNGPYRSVSFCKEFFEDFMAVNLKGSGWDFDPMNDLLKKHAGSSIQARVAIPHYKQLPYRLDKCPQLTFDAKDGRLKYEGKTVAVWLPKQLDALMPVTDEKLAPGSIVVTY